MASQSEAPSQSEPVTIETLQEGVIEIVAESIDIEPEEVELDMLLVDDLEVDSLDVLDMNYRVNRRYGVTLPLADMKKKFEEEQILWLDEEGRVTEEGIKELRDFLPEVGEDRLQVGDQVDAVFRVLTVHDIVKMLGRKLDL